MTSDRVRVILPGLTMAPEEYLSLARLLPGETRILDSWRVSVTASTAAIRGELGVTERPVILIGHSVGALAALEWMLREPAMVERVYLIDPSNPEASSAVRAGAPRIGRGLLRAVTRLAPVGRGLGLASRRRFLSGYGVESEHLDAAVVDARFGTREAAMFFWDELQARGDLRARVRALLDDPLALVGAPPILQVNSLLAPAKDLAARRRLATQLGSGLVEVNLGHLFPVTDPEHAASLLADDPRPE